MNQKTYTLSPPKKNMLAFNKEIFFLTACFVFFAFITPFLIGQIGHFLFSLFVVIVAVVTVSKLINRVHNPSVTLDRANDDADFYFITKIVIIGFILRFLAVYIVAFLLKKYVGIPFVSSKDDYIYHESALSIYYYWKINGFFSSLVDSHIRYGTGAYSGYPLFSALTMVLFGPNVYSPRIGNALLSAWSLLLVYQNLLLFTEKKQANIGAILFCYNPLFIVFSALQYKDTMLLFSMLWIMKYLHNILLHKKILFSTFCAILGAILLLVTRPATLLVFPVGYILYIILYHKSDQRHVFSSKLLGGVFISLIVISICVVWYILGRWGYLDEFGKFVISRYEAIRYRTLQNSSQAMIMRYDIAGIFKAPFFMLGMFYLPPLLITNFPYLESINYAYPGMLFYYIFLPYSLYAVYVTLKNRSNKIALYLLCLFIVYKVGQCFSLLTVLSIRQSLPAMAIMTMLLPIVFEDTKKYPPALFIIINVLIIICMLLLYALLRMYSRGLL